MLRLGALPEESARELLARPRGGFSLNGEVRIPAQDRPALERLLRYVLRPALSVKRLSYRPEEDRVSYRPKKGAPGTAPVLEWTPPEFLERFARLIPPPRLHLVRYYAALGPRSKLRPAVTAAARDQAPFETLEAGFALGGMAAAGRALSRAFGSAVSAAARSWAACLRRVFEVDPLLCPSCRAEMTPVAVLLDDRELTRVLAHLGLDTDFPKTQPARAPPRSEDFADTQLDASIDAWDGRDPAAPEE
jgi:hypothetical protein